MTTRKPEPVASYVYDGAQLLGLVDQADDGRWYAVHRKKMLGHFTDRREACRVLHEAIEAEETMPR